jgi:hypothetical protein
MGTRLGRAWILAGLGALLLAAQAVAATREVGSVGTHAATTCAAVGAHVAALVVATPLPRSGPRVAVFVLAIVGIVVGALFLMAALVMFAFSGHGAH